MKRDGMTPLECKAQDLFRTWSKEARPVIARVVRDFPKELEGLQYRADSPNSDESGFQLVTLTTNSDNPYARSYFDDVYEKSLENPSFQMDIAHEMVYHLKKAYEHYPLARVDNPRRNKLLSELKCRTGTDVKKEINSLLKESH